MIISKRYNQFVLCTVGSHITYSVYVKAIKIIEVFIKVKIFWLECSISKKNTVEFFIIS